MYNQYHEMGMTSIVIICYKDSEGKPVVYLKLKSSYIAQAMRFDRIAKLMGVPSASFIDTYYAKVTDLMINLVEYIQSLENRLSPPEQNGTGTASNIGNGTGNNISPMSSPLTLILQQSLKGYPIIPDPIPSEGWKKTHWENLFSDFIHQQYHWL